jgi:hypothetical protein
MCLLTISVRLLSFFACAAGMWPHRLQVQWQWADCSSYINGTIRMAPKDGGLAGCCHAVLLHRHWRYTAACAPRSRATMHTLECERQ